MTLHVAFSGDRHWTDVDRIVELLKELPADAVIIHGDQGHIKANGMPVGVDRIVDVYATILNHAGITQFTIMPFPAGWDTQGKAAGPIRNGTMVQRLNRARKEGHETRLIAVHPDLDSKSKGTKNMVRLTKMAGHEVRLVEN